MSNSSPSHRTTLNIPNELLAQIDEAVKQRGFKDRTDFIIKALEHYLKCYGSSSKDNLKWIINKYNNVHCTECNKPIKTGEQMLYSKEPYRRICVKCNLALKLKPIDIESLSPDIPPCEYRTITNDGKVYCDLKEIPLEVCLNRQKRYLKKKEQCLPKDEKKSTRETYHKEKHQPSIIQITNTNENAVSTTSFFKPSSLNLKFKCPKMGEEVPKETCYKICPLEIERKTCESIRLMEPEKFEELYQRKIKEMKEKGEL